MESQRAVSRDIFQQVMTVGFGIVQNFAVLFELISPVKQHLCQV